MWAIDRKYVPKAFGNIYTKRLVFVMVLNCRKMKDKCMKTTVDDNTSISMLNPIYEKDNT